MSEIDNCFDVPPNPGEPYALWDGSDHWRVRYKGEEYVIESAAVLSTTMFMMVSDYYEGGHW